MEAMLEDEEFAELATLPDSSTKKPHRRMSDWSPSVELLTAILDRLGELTQAVAALGGAKPRRVPTAPRPVTALERVRDRRRKQKHLSVVARVLPRKSDGPAKGSDSAGGDPPAAG